MPRVRLFALTAAGAAMLLALAAADRPRALAPVAGGLWEISRSPASSAATRLCVADPSVLAQFEHRSKSCTRVVISDDPTSAVIHYTCQGADFGRSKVTVLTPRSLRIETTGISGNAPFSYVLQARRSGDC